MQDMNEEVQKNFGFLWQIPSFQYLSFQATSFRSSTIVKDGAMQYSFDLKPNLSFTSEFTSAGYKRHIRLYIIYYHIHDASPSPARCCVIR